MKQNSHGIFYDQEDPTTCGIALIRTVLENNFNIKNCLIWEKNKALGVLVIWKVHF